MKKITRFSASLEPEILKKLDAYQKEHNLPSRSDALRALVRGYMLEKAWNTKGKVYAIISMVYDHHGRETMRKITEIQHDTKAHILVSQHLHLTHHDCLESITVEGKAEEIKKLSDALGAVNGVKRVSLSKIAAAEDLED
ncbi:CopG family nickel-responsive transcriptional regulator [Elusimicrobium posterum]|uniref:nickel-responsive transcriptional regulator NikR n=1 Tax=Elusimicrobium posterum TaxID=3116653 RepID=UPI003C740459